MKSKKTVLMNPFAGKEGRCRCREGPCGHTVREGESAVNGESSIDIYILPRVRQIAGRKLPPGLCDDLEVWDRGGEGGSRARVYMCNYG